MKKQLLLLLTLLLCSTAAWAATEYGIYVAGTKVTSDNCNNIVNNYITGGTVVYTPSTKTLTLTNVTINTGTTDNNGINNYNCEGLNVRFVGTCNITINDGDKNAINVEKKTYVTVVSGTTTLTQKASGSDCIYVKTHNWASLYISGPGKLILNAPSGNGIVCQTLSDDGFMQLDYPPAPVTYQNDCNVTITSARYGLRRGAHYFEDGTVTIKATNNSSYPNVWVAYVELNNGSVVTAPDGATAPTTWYDSSESSSVKVNGTSVYTQDVVISNKYKLLLNSTNFPDANFRAYMRSLYPKGYMTQDEVNSLTTLSVQGKSIANMTGVEKLTALQKLNCWNNSFTTLNLNSNTALTYLDCAPNTQLTSLSIGNCTNLETLNCYNTGITSLTLTNLSKLKTLNCYSTKLTRLSVTNKSQLTMVNCSNCTSMTSATISSNSALFSLNISGCTALTSLYCDRNNLTTLNITGNTALNTLECYNNNNLASITGLADCTAITNLMCNYCALTDLSACNSMTNLAQLYCDNNKLTSLTLTSKSKLTSVGASGNTSMTTATITGNSALKSLNIQGCTALTTLTCYSNPALTTLNVTGNTALNSLNCTTCRSLASITGLASCTAITSLNCGDCAFTDLSAANSMSNLTTLACYNNKLTSLTLTNKSKLTFVNAYGNTSMTSATITGNSALATLYMQGCTALTTLDCYHNALTTLNVTDNAAMTHLYCYNNKLSSLDVSTLTNLTNLTCHNNQLTALNVNYNNKLQYLYCYDNKLTSLNLANKTSLRVLNCGWNQLTSLNVQGCSAMWFLYCQYNKLTSLYVQGCTALTTVNCNVNQMTASGMTTLVNSLPTCTAASPGTLYALTTSTPSVSGYTEGNVFNAAHLTAAQAKYWIPKQYNGSSWVDITFSTRGDVDGDGKISISDVTELISLLLNGTATVSAHPAADTDLDGKISISDVTALISYLLSGSW